MIYENPAKRLLNILQKGLKQKGGANCKDVWCSLLEVNTSNLPLLMARLGKVMDLPNQIIVAINDNFPDQKSSYAHWSAHINKGFMSQNINGPWSGFINCIDTHSITYLKLSSALLDTLETTEHIPESDLADLRDKVNSLLVESKDADIDMEFKKYIVRYLQKILIAIDEYDISGAVPISESIESALGHAFLDKNYHFNISNTEFGKNFVNVLSVVASAVTTAVGLPQLPDTFKFLLGAPN